MSSCYIIFLTKIYEAELGTLFDGNGGTWYWQIEVTNEDYTIKSEVFQFNICESELRRASNCHSFD
jgi:hypothetical protein